jgi:hypothetical protein
MNPFASRIHRHLIAIAAIPLACCWALAAAAGGEPDVWVVSTRQLPGICRLPATADVRVERLDPGTHCWHASDVPSLLDDPTRPLMVFIHGNRYDSAAAKSQGIWLARRAAALDPAAPAVRTVIFSWPSEQQGILLKDGRAKYRRAFSDGHYFAWLLGRIEGERPLAIVSYSFGALVTLQAMEDLVAAEQAGRTDIQPWTPRTGRTNVVFVAPAVRCDALSPRGPYRNAFACFDRLTLIINSQDDALRFFPFLDHGVHAAALGYVGMPRRWLPSGVEFVDTDAAAIVGKNHGLPLYLSSPVLSSRIATGAIAGLQDAAADLSARQ